MAVRFDAAAEYYSGSAGVPAGTAWSVCFWMLLSGDRDTACGVFAFDNGLDASGQSVFLSTDFDGTTMHAFDLGDNGGGFGNLPLTV
ncbi:MAG: hypothetical protein ACRDUA_17205, partial [Micromonosporaceae bacterium]